MATNKPLVTSRDPIGAQIVSICAAAFDQSKLDELRTRLLQKRGGELKARIAQAIADLTKLPTAHDKAREIMGQNMFGVEEAVKHFGVKPTKKQLAKLADIPFSPEVLTSVKDTHILVATFPLSITDVRAKMAGRTGQPVFYGQDWYNTEKFATTKCELGWHLVRKTAVPDSTSKSWDEQQALLAKDDETPTARVLVYTVVGHYLATRVRLFPGIWVRCSDVGSGGRRVAVGFFGEGGLRVNDGVGGCRYSDLAVSSSRKSHS
ncbi:MAG: hypothetical protein WC764_02355 [Candidatus Paceibacterota bacterium]|jgi:hypothetical protein